MISAFYHTNGHSRPLFLMLLFATFKNSFFTIFGLYISWEFLDLWSIDGDFPLVSPFFCLSKILHSPTIQFRALKPPNLQILTSNQPKPYPSTITVVPVYRKGLKLNLWPFFSWWIPIQKLGCFRKPMTFAFSHINDHLRPFFLMHLFSILK